MTFANGFKHSDISCRAETAGVRGLGTAHDATPRVCNAIQVFGAFIYEICCHDLEVFKILSVAAKSRY